MAFWVPNLSRIGGIYCLHTSPSNINTVHIYRSIVWLITSIYVNVCNSTILINFRHVPISFCQHRHGQNS